MGAVGRPSSVLMVLVVRSGMEAKRFSPSFASFINPLTICKCDNGHSRELKAKA